MRRPIAVEELVEMIDEMVSVHDREGRFVYLNAAAARTFGMPASELLGKRPTDVVATSQPPSPLRIGLEAVLAGGPRTRMTSFVAAFQRWYDIEIHPHAEGALVIARDITAAHEVHEELARSEARFRGMVESSPEAIVILDASSGRFSDANEAAERMFGRTREELLAIGPLDLIDRSDGDPTPRFVESVQRAIAGETLTMEWPALGANDERITVEVHARRLPSESPILIRASMFDITERKRVQAQFEEVQRLEAVARLAGGVAHDFNNMLTVIIAGIQLAMHRLPPDHGARSDLEEAINAAERSALITKQLLTFGRKQAARPVALDLTAYIDGVAPLMQRLVGEDVEIQLDLARPIARTSIDPAHVEQILFNLVANARDAMPGGGTLTIATANVYLDTEYERLHNGVPPGRYVLVSVADTGEGIPASAKPHIFEPFYSTKTLERGTGLGLATVYGIVKFNHGHIWVYSEVGMGATFKVYLPISEAPAVAETVLPVSPVTTGTETILVVEDDSQVRAVLRRTLQRAGYTVLEASNAGEALLIVENHEPIHVLLTDVVMPRMTGPQLAARLQPLKPDMRVVYISGYNEAQLEGPGTATYAALLPKPVSREALLACIREVLDRT